MLSRINKGANFNEHLLISNEPSFHGENVTGLKRSCWVSPGSAIRCAVLCCGVIGSNSFTMKGVLLSLKRYVDTLLSWMKVKWKTVRWYLLWPFHKVDKRDIFITNFMGISQRVWPYLSYRQIEEVQNTWR